MAHRSTTLDKVLPAPESIRKRTAAKSEPGRSTRTPEVATFGAKKPANFDKRKMLLGGSYTHKHKSGELLTLTFPILIIFHTAHAYRDRWETTMHRHKCAHASERKGTQALALD